MLNKEEEEDDEHRMKKHQRTKVKIHELQNYTKTGQRIEVLKHST